MSRPILFACGILGIAAAAAAMRTSWSPVDAFLELRGAPVPQQAMLTTDASPTALAGTSRAPFGAYNPKADAPAAFASGAAASHDSAGKSTASAFSNDRLHGAYSAGSSGPSASAGNLWRLMGLSRSHTAATPSATTHATTPRQPAPPKPAKTPSTHTGSPSHGAAPVATLATTTPVILIGDNPTPVSGLIGGSSGTTVPPPGGGHISGSGGSVGGLSATPEPAPVLLVGTGLIGLAAILRRRRA